MEFLKRPIKWIIIGLVLLAGGCDPFVTTFEDDGEVYAYKARDLTAVTTPDTLIVMTWNIKFGGGDIDFWYDCHGERVLMRRQEVLDNMAGVAKIIREIDPDLLLLQEVDIESKRSVFIDEMQYLLNETDLNYGVYASIWQVQYIPSDGLGAMNAGNAILSKWELHDAQRIALALRTDQDALTQYFYLRRNIIKARVALPGMDNLYALTVHAAAFSQDGTKRKHIDAFKRALDEIDADGGLFLAGGDLNTLPPGSLKLSGFEDSVCEDEQFQSDDHTEETDWLDSFYADVSTGGYHPAIALSIYQADNSLQFSHTTLPLKGFKRKLDYLFTNSTAGWVANSGVTHQSISDGTTAWSDHAPISVAWVLP